MATFIVSFDTEEQAQEAITRLSEAGFGEVRARVLDSSESLSYPKDTGTSPMITPELGSIEVRPEEIPQVPEAMHEDQNPNESATIPTTGKSAAGVQVMVEVDDLHQEAARQLLGINGSTGQQ